MKLSELFSGKTNIDNVPQTVYAKEHNRVADVERQLHSLVPGQTIRGEIIGRNGSELQIRLAEDMVLNARIDRNINLELGKVLTFEVKNNGVTLMLSPLFTNVSTDVNVLKALDMAGLPVNENSVSMTEQMMKAGLPVNRNVLQQVYREISAFPEGEISDVISLHKLQLPVNESTMNQIASYRNLTYQLTSAMDTVLEGIPQALENMLQEGNVQAAADVYHELFAMLKEGMAFSDSSEGVAASEGTVTSEGIVTSERTVITEGIVTSEGEAVSGGISAAKEEILRGQSVEIDTATQDAFIPRSMRTELAEFFSEALGELPLTPEEKQTFSEQIRGFVQGETSVEDLFAVAEKLLATAESDEQKLAVLHGLLKHQNFHALLAKQLTDLWTIRPEEVEKQEKITELYRRLDRQLGSLTRALEAGGQSESSAFKAASSMSQNIDFLQQLNQMYAYIQLPLRLQQGNTHGDFYVYANRKGLASADGQVSALLHLDMEHLGPLDVYVTLHQTKVNTKFYVKDDEMLDFLEKHMELLTERLKNRGYDCDFSMTARGEKEGKSEDKGLAPILGQDKGILLTQYSFDVRT